MPRRWVYVAAFLPVLPLGVGGMPVAAAPVVVSPAADGTIVDGAPYGVRDGTADAADWTFNESGYEGSISIVDGGSAFEHRVVFEFDLRSVTAAPPVTAELDFRLRGAPRFPASPVTVLVYAYPADLLERMQDFSGGPAELVAAESIAPYQPPTPFRVNISGLVSSVLESGVDKIGFRFQIDPQSPDEVNQAFLDARDSDPSTKPSLSIEGRVPGDSDADRDVDLNDAAAISQCVRGPGVTATVSCRVFDGDLDLDVDLEDFVRFMTVFPTPAP